MSFSRIGQGRQYGHDPFGTLIIGVGDRQRRDDGIGPFIVERLEKILHIAETFRFLTVPRLTLQIADEIHSAGVLIFFGSTVEILKEGWRCAPLVPEKVCPDFQTRHLSPALLLGVFQSLHHRNPPTWMVSVQGNNFGFGDEITPVARKRVEKAFSNIVETVLRVHEGV